MAKKEKSIKEESQLPSGYQKTSLNGPQNWVSWAPGVIVEGELLGRFERRSSPGQHFYQVKLARAVEATRGAGEEKEVLEVPAGETVCFDEKSQLRDLGALLDTNNRYQVFVQAIRKEKMRNGQGMIWLFEVGHKIIGSRGAPLNGANRKATDADEIPFA